PEEDATLEEPLEEERPERVEVAALPPHVERRDEADRAHARDLGPPRERGEPLLVDRLDASDARESALLEESEALERDRARERVRRVAVAVEERPPALVREEGVVDGVRRERRGERQHASRERLREAEDVGRDPRVLAGEHPPCAAKARQD